MAVTKLWPVMARLDQVIDYATDPEKTEKANSKYSEADYQALKDVLAYAKDEEKTEQEFFCQAINCEVATAREDFITTKERFGKNDGVQAYHGYLSFKEQDITPELAQHIGMEYAQELWGDRFQVVVTTHLNTKHLHCHFVVNSVSCVDGKRCQMTSWFKFHKVADRICEKYGLHVIENPERYPLSDFMKERDRRGEPTRYNILRHAIDESIACSRDWHEFEAAMAQFGCTFKYNGKRKYWSAIPKGYDKPVRLYRLGEEYGRDRIMERLRENRGKVLMKPFIQGQPQPRQYLLVTREQRLRKKGGLYGRYLYYCYRLGYLPKYKKQNPAHIHYLFRDDLMKLDELTAQTRLLGSHRIETDEQLFAYRHKVEANITELTDVRTDLRNEIRRTGLSETELTEAKEEISQISQRLKTLRKELKLCDGIAERSGVIDQNIQQVLAEEKEKSQGKERDKYDKQR